MIEVRAVPEEDWPVLGALSAEAYGGPPNDTWLASLRHSTSVGAYDGGRLVSHARVKPYRQWFGGRAVPMGGVASVAVTASHQRRGVAKATVSALLPVMRERGQVVSALYPSTVALYRSMGWERAGDYTWLDVRGPALRALGPVEGVTLRPAEQADVAGIRAAYEAVCRDTAGMLDRTGPFFDRSPLDGDASVVVAEGDGIEGYAIADRRNRGHTTEVTAWDVTATTVAAERAVWFWLGAGASVVPTVRAKAYADSLPLHLADADAAVTVHEHQRWMLRLVDAPAAVAARGWPAGLAARVDLDVRDDLVADNAGRWRLAVEGGSGSLTRGGDGTVALDVGALSALYTGYADPRTLRRAGRLTTTDEAALDALATMTAGPRPRMLDYF